MSFKEILYIGKEEKCARKERHRESLSGERSRHIGEHHPPLAGAFYGGSQVKITRISRCPDSICLREGRGGVVKIKSSFDRRSLLTARTDEEERKDGARREDDIKAKCVVGDERNITESTLKTFPGDAACIIIIASYGSLRNSYVRRRFRVIDAITHPVFR